jgi:hypothetical protein
VSRVKTGKREVAIGMLLVLLALLAVAIGWGNGEAMAALEMLAPLVMLWSAGAFGVDEYSKNIAGRK